MVQSSKQFDLEERTLTFARQIRIFIKKIPKTISNFEDVKQVVRSSRSIGANYIEANESLGKKDFVMRVKIARKESKETRYWLQLLDLNDNQTLQDELSDLLKEVNELLKILSAIITKSL
jgi:four helix bundle protein